MATLAAPHATATDELPRPVRFDVAPFLLHPDDRLFATVLLAGDEEAREAWRRWTARAGDWTDPATASGRTAKAFAPLLLAALDRCGVGISGGVSVGGVSVSVSVSGGGEGVEGVDRAHLAALRAWRLAEQQRTARVDAAVADVLEALSRARIPALVVGGTAFTADVYDAPSERHCHDLDLVVPGEAGPAAVQVLQRANCVRAAESAMPFVPPAAVQVLQRTDCVPAAESAMQFVPRAAVQILQRSDCVPVAETAMQSAPGADARMPAGGARVTTAGAAPAVRLLHASGLTIVLRMRRVHDVPAALDFTALHDAHRPLTVAGREIAALDRGHALVLACLPGFTARHRIEAVRAAVDAAKLGARMDAVEWMRAREAARRHDLSLLLHATLGLVADTVGVRVPPRVESGLAADATADANRAFSRLLPMLTGAPRSIGALVDLDGGWSARATVARAMLFPPREYLAPARASGLTRVDVAAHGLRRVLRWCARGAAGA